MSKKDKEKSNLGIDNVIENTFNHLKDIVDANTVVGKVIKVTDNNYLIPVSKISVGLISGGGTIPKAKSENLSAGSGTGFNIVPIGFVAISQNDFKFVPVNVVTDLSKSLIDLCYKLYDMYFKKDKGEDGNDKEN